MFTICVASGMISGSGPQRYKKLQGQELLGLAKDSKCRPSTGRRVEHMAFFYHKGGFSKQHFGLWVKQDSIDVDHSCIQLSNRPHGRCCWPARWLGTNLTWNKSATNPAAHCGSTLRTAKNKTRYNQISVLVWKTVTIYNSGRTGYAHRFRNLKCSTPAAPQTHCFVSSIGQTLRIQTARHLLPQKQNLNKPLTV